MTIPVLGVPVLNRPDYFQKMLDSIDEEVERLIVIDNSTDGSITAAMSGPNLTVIRPNHNLGVSASWNLIIKSAPLAPWWCIVNADLELAPGDLARLREHMETVGGMGLLLTPSAFGITPDAIQRAGWFDENFIPAYCEDNDYVYRCKLTGVPVEALQAGLSHVGSGVIRSDVNLWFENMNSFPQNVDYYRLKWGGEMTQEVYTTPFNKGGDPREWHLELDRLTRLTWKSI